MGLLSMFKRKDNREEVEKIHIWLENNPPHPSLVPDCDKASYEQYTLELYSKYQMLMEERNKTKDIEYRTFLVDMINRIEATKPFAPPPLLEEVNSANDCIDLTCQPHIEAKVDKDCIDLSVSWD